MGLKIPANVIKDKPSQYDIHLTPAQGHIMATKTTTNQDGSKNEKILLQEDPVVHPGIQTNGPPCKMRVSGGRTLQPVQFESVRFDVALEVPFEKDDIEATYDWVTDWISTKMQEAEKQVKG